jgi:diacylglycerol kinase
MIKKYFKKFPHALRGIFYAIKSDFGFRTQIYLGAGLGIITGLAFRPLTSNEFLFLILAWVLILITELQNSALEIALNRLHPELHDDIKRSKDMAAGAVLIAGIFLLIIMVIIGYNRWF